MKRALCVLWLGVFAAAACAEAPAAPESAAQKLGYSIGYQVGGDFRRQGRELDPELVIRGVRHALEGAEPSLTPAEMRRILFAFEQESAGAKGGGTGDPEGSRE
jgi:FKBP-type peptidyl-prolyl cis-trans isomerase FklB